MVASLTRTVFVALLVLIAGCSAAPGIDDGTPGGSTAAAASPAPDDQALSPGLYRPVSFEQPGRYVFAIATQYEAEPGTVVFDVRSVARSDTEIVVDIRFAGGSHQTTVSGDRIDVNDGLLTVVDGVDAIDADLRIYETVFEPGAWTLGGTLDVGAEWGVAIDAPGVAGDDSIDSTLTVTGTNVIGGVSCYVVKGVAQDDGRIVYEGCLSPAHGFPMQSIYYDESGQVVSLLELQSYESA